jgi:type IV secretory pathway VirB2 component (pilin)
MQQIINTVNQIIQAGQLIGATALVAVVLFMGYSVWWGGKNGMDVAKRLVLPIIVGAVLVFGAPALSQWLQSIVS